MHALQANSEGCVIRDHIPLVGFVALFRKEEREGTRGTSATSIKTFGHLAVIDHPEEFDDTKIRRD